MTEKPTQKQIDFATTISETIGADLPEVFSKSAYHDFINDNIDYFYEVRDEIRYKNRNTFQLSHSYVLDKEFNGSGSLRRNPQRMY